MGEAHPAQCGLRPKPNRHTRGHATAIVSAPDRAWSWPDYCAPPTCTMHSSAAHLPYPLHKPERRSETHLLHFTLTLLRCSAAASRCLRALPTTLPQATGTSLKRLGVVLSQASPWAAALCQKLVKHQALHRLHLLAVAIGALPS
jgi:hypothetical protein